MGELVARMRKALDRTAYRGGYIGRGGSFVRIGWDDEIADRLLEQLAVDGLEICASDEPIPAPAPVPAP